MLLCLMVSAGVILPKEEEGFTVNQLKQRGQTKDKPTGGNLNGIISGIMELWQQVIMTRATTER